MVRLALRFSMLLVLLVQFPLGSARGESVQFSANLSTLTRFADPQNASRAFYQTVWLLPPEATKVTDVQIQWTLGEPIPPEEGATQPGTLRSLDTGEPVASLPWRESKDVRVLSLGKEGDVVLLPLLLTPPARARSGLLTVTYRAIPTHRPFHRVVGRMARLAVNWDQLGEWYRPKLMREGDPNMVIVTTQQFKETSTRLEEYVALKENQGFRPVLITLEEVLGVCAEEEGSANYRQICLRNWLIERFEEWPLEYLIILAGPDPGDDSGIPMLVCHPARGYEDGAGDAPTDFFYADLTGNWNLDGDAFPCELEDYLSVAEDGTLSSLEGGVDLIPELVVARIPHQGTLPYYGDSVLARLIRYADIPPARWHNRILLPSPQVTFPNGTWVDTSLIASYMDEQTFSKFAITPVRLSEAEGNLRSIVQSERPLNWQNLVLEWGIGHAVVFWCAHGSAEGAYRDVWLNDSNSDGLPQQTEVEEPAFINKLLGKQDLNDDFPPIVFHGSCLNSEPEEHGNLAHTILRNFSVADVASTRVTMGLAPGGDSSWKPSPFTPGAFTLGVYFVHLLMGKRETVGHAFQEAMSALTFGGQPSTLKVRLEFNLYGDPTIVVPGCESDEHCLDGNVCNGSERCEDGQCVPGVPLVCDIPEDTVGACQTTTCDPKEGCTLGPAESYAPCDDGDLCTEGDYCWEGSCVSTPKFCYVPNPYCYNAWCDGETGECISEASQDGTPCTNPKGAGLCQEGYCINDVPTESLEDTTDEDDVVASIEESAPEVAHEGSGGCQTHAVPLETLPMVLLLFFLAISLLVRRRIPQRLFGFFA